MTSDIFLDGLLKVVFIFLPDAALQRCPYSVLVAGAAL
jgi:hypothetical protein